MRSKRMLLANLNNVRKLKNNIHNLPKNKTKNDINVKVKKKSEKGINNQRNNLYYIKGNKYRHIHKKTPIIHGTLRT